MDIKCKRKHSDFALTNIMEKSSTDPKIVSLSLTTTPTASMQTAKAEITAQTVESLPPH